MILLFIKFIYSEKATKVLRNLPLTFDHSTYSQKLVEDFAKFCGLLRIYELYLKACLTYQFSDIDRLSVKDSTLVHRILFDGKKAIGVEIEKNGTRENIYSNEVILSGGAINSPQLLMLSGIGNADHLKSLDIPVVAHVPGVGENLQDHLELGVAQKCKKPITLLKEQKFPKMIQIGKYCLFIMLACF